MGDAAALARAIFAGCSANVGPLIGIELGAGEASLAAVQTPPEGVLAVLPLDVELGAGEPARIELASPLEDLARLARRMLGNDDPDTKRELSDDDREAIGEILGVMGGSVEQGLREQVGAGLRARPLAWWCSDQPGDAAYAAGARQVAKGSLKLPGGQDAALLLLFPADLFERGRAAPVGPGRSQVLLLDLEAEAGEALARALSAAGLEVCSAPPSEAEGWREIGAAIVSGAGERGFERARRLRTADATWQLPVLLCAGQPTRSLVIRALECGASHVLAMPAADSEVLRVLELARAPAR
jgi:CheY-like chemotaxis protein